MTEKDDEVLSVLKEIEKWTRVQAFDLLRSKLKELDKTDLQIYELSTESNSLRDIAEELEASHGKIADKKKDFYKMGLMDKKTVRGGNSRFVRIAPLKDLGLEPPEDVT